MNYMIVALPFWLMHFLPPVFLLSPKKFTFSPDPPFFSPISVNAALRKTLIYPSILGGIPLTQLRVS